MSMHDPIYVMLYSGVFEEDTTNAALKDVLIYFYAGSAGIRIRNLRNKEEWEYATPSDVPKEFLAYLVLMDVTYTFRGGG